MKRSKITAYHGELFNFRTGEVVRAATAREKAASERAAGDGGEVGVIVVDGVACFVQHGNFTAPRLEEPEPDEEPEPEPEPVSKPKKPRRGS